MDVRSLLVFEKWPWVSSKPRKKKVISGTVLVSMHDRCKQAVHLRNKRPGAHKPVEGVDASARGGQAEFWERRAPCVAFQVIVLEPTTGSGRRLCLVVRYLLSIPVHRFALTCAKENTSKTNRSVRTSIGSVARLQSGGRPA